MSGGKTIGADASLQVEGDGSDVAETLKHEALRIRGIHLLLAAYVKRDTPGDDSHPFERRRVEKALRACVRLRAMVLSTLPHLSRLSSRSRFYVHDALDFVTSVEDTFRTDHARSIEKRDS